MDIAAPVTDRRGPVKSDPRNYLHYACEDQQGIRRHTKVLAGGRRRHRHTDGAVGPLQRYADGAPRWHFELDVPPAAAPAAPLAEERQRGAVKRVDRQRDGDGFRRRMGT